jgi:membrane protein YqaA with SNARE-associated domain
MMRAQEKFMKDPTRPQAVAIALWNPFFWIRRTYDWTIQWAEHRRSLHALSFLAFIESIFFPVPADVLLMLMGAAKPKKALYYGMVCSFFSVLGGAAGYVLGYYAWQAVDSLFFRFVFSQELFLKVGLLFEQNAFWAIFTAAFTPIPFKVFTVAGGAFQISFLPFLAGALLGRPLRFMLVSSLLYFFGAPVRDLVEKYFNLFTILFALLLVGGFAVIKLL